MIKQRKTGWLAIFSSLILSALLLAACGANIPAETVPAEPASAEPENTADGISKETETISDIGEIFEEASESSSVSNDNVDAIPADSEVDASGVPVGFTESGNPYRGNPNAPVVIEEFSDFQ